MGECSAAVPNDAPLMMAWNAYKETAEYGTARRWAVHEQHTEGSLWAAFVEGFKAAGGSVWPVQQGAKGGAERSECEANQNPENVQGEA